MAGNRDIEFSQEGIKISYRRFLSDSAAGYIVILIAILSFNVPIFGEHRQISSYIIFDPNTKIFLFILIFLLATPLGLAINSSSWMFLGRLRIVSTEILWYEKSESQTKSIKNLFLSFFDIFIHNTKKSLLFKETKPFYGFKKESFLDHYRLIEDTLSIHHPDIKESITSSQGLFILFRNIAFLLIIYFGYVFIYFIKVGNLPISFENIIILIIFFIFIIINYLESMIYYYLSILLMGYLLCKSGNKESCDALCKMDEVINFIADTKVR